MSGEKALKARKIPLEKVLRAYQFYKSKRKVASALGLSVETVTKILREKKVMKPWSGFKGIKPWRGGNRGPVTRWIQEHPGIQLPSKPKQIAKLIGCTVTDVHSWRTARLAKFKKLLPLVPKEAVQTIRSRTLQVQLRDGKLLGLEDLDRIAKLIAGQNAGARS